jgi:hypothetical protein
VVAPHRGPLASGTRATRRAWLQRFWEALTAQAWEELCRRQIPQLDLQSPLGRLWPWLPAARWWKGNEPEWDLVSESVDEKRLLLGEVKWSAKPFTLAASRRAFGELQGRPAPALPARWAGHEIVRALFVPEIEGTPGGDPGGPSIVSAAELLQPVLLR